MADFADEKIRAVAYELWERDGSPEGRDEEYWHAAVKLLSDEGEIDEPSELAGVPVPPIVPKV